MFQGPVPTWARAIGGVSDLLGRAEIDAAMVPTQLGRDVDQILAPV